MLLTEEWTRTGTAWRCDTCEVDLPSLASHVSPLLREGNHHIAYKEMLQQKLQQLASDGWTPRYEGVECKLLQQALLRGMRPRPRNSSSCCSSNPSSNDNDPCSYMNSSCCKDFCRPPRRAVAPQRSRRPQRDGDGQHTPAVTAAAAALHRNS